MYRQSPSRNQRSKGIRVKHVLQICLLLAICFWLIYQVKHSHDKRKTLDESDGRGLLQRESGDDLIKIGRKDIQARSEGTFAKNEKHEELEEEEEEEVKETKNEEDELGDKKAEGNEGEAVEGGEDEVDGRELEKSDEDDDREEDLVDEEKEREDGVENDSQEAHGQVEKDVSAEDGDHGVDDGSVDEAREEHYKADDASSAVTHDAQIATTENENEHLENSKGNPHNILEYENNENKNEGEERKGLEVEGGEMARDDHHSNTTASETEEGLLDNSNNGSPPKNTVTEGFGARLMSNSTPEITTENHDSSSQTVTESKPELNHNPEALINDTSGEGSKSKFTDSNQANDSTVNADSSDVGSNSTDSTELIHAEVHSKESSNSPTNNTEIIKSEASVEADMNGSSPQKNDEGKVGISDINELTDDTTESTMKEDHADDPHDTIDISDTPNSLEENNVHMDLNTLPELQIEGTNSKDVAAE